MILSDPVAIALITSISGVVVTIANLVVTLLTKRNVRTLKDTVKQQHTETRLSLAAAMCHHPVDVHTPPASRSVKP